jgi:hypothetical protein
MSIERDAALLNLMNYIEEELQSFSQVRVRIRQVSSSKRSPDLVQDYDTESNNLHCARGVQVRARSREYFFPIEWASSHNRKTVDQALQEIKSFLDLSRD